MMRFVYILIFSLVLGSTCHSSDQRGIQVVVPNRSETGFLGRYYAYIVGINAYYEGFPVLKTAVKDAQELRKILTEKYDFEAEQVFLRVDEQATQFNIINDLKIISSKLTDRDNLLIYYAGHGQIDEFLGDGYWIPSDGKPQNPGTWVSHSLIRNILSSEKLKAKNIALISDSCYSGSLLRSGPSTLPISDLNYTQKIFELSSLRSRQVFTSGGVEPVVDGGRDGHSLFAYYFIKALKENNLDLIDLENLFYTNVWKQVAEIGDQRPYVGRLKTIMDDNGQFVLLQRSAKDKLQEKGVVLDRVFIESHHLGQHTNQKRLKLAIFPFLLEKNFSFRSTEVGDHESFKNILVGIINDTFREDTIFIPTYTYYQLKKPVPEIPDRLITEDMIQKLWHSNWTSIDKRPNLDLFCYLGSQLKVDKILTYWFYMDSHDIIVKGFLIDVKEKSVVEKVEKERNTFTMSGVSSSVKQYAKSITLAILN